MPLHGIGCRRNSDALKHRPVALSNSVLASSVSTSLELRSVTDADWPAMSLLGATSFGGFLHPDSLTAWRTMMPTDSTVVACDGGDIVGMSHYLDLQLTVPGGAVVPVAGITWVAVAPTHRRRGVLRAMYTELHQRIAEARYPIAALTASEGGIYGRFGYGPATIERELTIDRPVAQFHARRPRPRRRPVRKAGRTPRRDFRDLRAVAATHAGRTRPTAGTVGRRARRSREEPLRRYRMVHLPASRRLRHVPDARPRPEPWLASTTSQRRPPTRISRCGGHCSGST